MSYSKDEVFASTLNYFDGDEMAANVWMSKYCLKELKPNGEIVYFEKNPDDMHRRLAREFCRAGEKYKNPLTFDEVYEVLKDFKYIVPQGRPMAGIGADDAVSISNCFVVGKPGQDSYGTIALVDQLLLQVSKRGGGAGTDLSDYRPNGSKVHNAAMTSSGPVEICANRFSNTIREVGQQGRRGALMLSMDINHPDAEAFMDSKLEEGKISGANISLKMHDDWLEEAISGNDKEKERLWNKIIHNATVKAEPGVLFWDTLIRESVADCYEKFGYKTISTNPCGELPLCAFDSCRLMLLNLYSYVKEPFTERADIDWDLLCKHSRLITKMMDNMIDLELEKIDKILVKIDSDPEDDETKKIERDLWIKVREKCKEGRRSGIGITGMGDMLAALGIKYGTPVATDIASHVQNVIAINSYIESCDLVQRDGRPAFGCFDWNLEKENPFLNRLVGGENDIWQKEFVKKWKNGRRNIALLTIAPAGSVSILTRTTSGIEPLFMPVYKRRRKIEHSDSVKPDFINKDGDWFTEYNVFHPKFIEWYRIFKQIISFADAKKELESMNDAEFDKVFKLSPYYGATSSDCDWVEKVRMQGEVQKYVDHSISVTVNLPKGTTEETVKRVYETAWRSGCKGCTIYVDGSREGVLIGKDTDCKCKETHLIHDAPKRPKVVSCDIKRFRNGGERWVAAIGLFEGLPYEIFTGLESELPVPSYVTEGKIIKNKREVEAIDEDTGKPVMKRVSRYDISYIDKDGVEQTVCGISDVFDDEYYNYSKLISGLLRHGMKPEYVVSTIKTMRFDNDNINSWKNGIMRSLRGYIADGVTKEKCPECGSFLVRESGCVHCANCGWSKCN